MSNAIPEWAAHTVSGVVRDGEQVRFVGEGRADVVPPSGLSALFYWIAYFLTNYFALFATARFLNRAVIIVTNQRVMIVSDRSWKFPLWTVILSKRLVFESIELSNVTALSTVMAQFMWVLSSKGILVESDSGAVRVINGLNKETFSSASKLMS